MFMPLENAIEKLKYFLIKNILRLKKSNSEKIIYYLKHEDLFFNKFNKQDKIIIEYDSVVELLNLCDKIEELYKKNDMNIFLPKIPDEVDIYTLEIFYSFENSYIENIKEINNLLLNRILNVYETDKKFINKDYKFFSKIIQPYIIILEKYLNILFKTV